MELLFCIAAVIGSATVFFLLVGGVELCVESFELWQLKRNRVHDDLNRHESEIRKLRDDLRGEELYSRSLKDYVEHVEKRVSAGYEYFLDDGNDVWKFLKGVKTGYIWGVSRKEWLSTRWCREDIQRSYAAKPITAARAEALTK